MSNPQDDIRLDRVVITDAQIRERISELSAQITHDYEGKELMLIGILKGSFIFLADLVRGIDYSVEIDFMAVSSYGQSLQSSGEVRIIKDIKSSIRGRHVLIVEDILDSGNTIKFLYKTLSAHNPASLEIATLLMRKSFIENMKVRYKGFDVGDEFLVGYGLDAREEYRNLREIRAIT